MIKEQSLVNLTISAEDLLVLQLGVDKKAAVNLIAELDKNNPYTFKNCDSTSLLTEIFIALVNCQELDHEKAIAKLKEFSFIRLKSFYKGLPIEQILALEEYKIRAFYFLLEHGLTVNFLLSSTWMNNKFYAEALIHLVRDKNWLLAEAIHTLKQLDLLQAKLITMNYDVECVLDLQINIENLIATHEAAENILINQSEQDLASLRKLQQLLQQEYTAELKLTDSILARYEFPPNTKTTATALFWLCKQRKGINFLSKLLQLNDVLLTELPIEMFTSSVESGPYTGVFPFLWLCEKSEGCMFLQELLQKDPGFIASIPGEIWARPVTNNHVYKNITALSFLSNNAEGVKVIQQLANGLPDYFQEHIEPYINALTSQKIFPIISLAA